ncbi:SWIM zinc finger family protein [Thalassomonas sp. RHCl1]|uniref:SWIM zinc finger family protein n=1 Tax=Thalassomonas sp. RHCl1 TaxID=2995320 RepID=UPI00248CD207|nr:SWIM zinc finger family protein [Thalassomonas sp. RHCl1]
MDIDIDKSILIRLAGEGAYQRGVKVYQSGAVLSVREKSNHILAKVEGTETYQVTLQITDKVLDGSCNCPASENFDFCKHCVATALAYQERQTEQDSLQNGAPLERIQAYINQLSEQETKEALFQLIGDDDLLTRKWQLKADNAAGAIDTKQLKKQITQALPYRSIWEYSKVRNYFVRAETTLEPIFDIFTTLKSEDAFSLCQYMSQRLNKVLERLDDSGGYRYSLEEQINEQLTTLFKQLPWAADKKSQFLLQALLNEDDYMVYPEIPGDFLDSATPEVNTLFYQAIQKAWDALPELAIDAGYDEQRPYNRLLYILLAQAKTEENLSGMITLKTKVAVHVRDFIELAELNLTQEHIEQAQLWLNKAQQHPDKFRHVIAIKQLTIKLLLARQQPLAALEIQWEIFTKTELFEDYQKLLTLTEQAGEDTTACYQQAESVLLKNSTDKQHNHWHAPGYSLVDFYIKNNQIEKAASYAINNKTDSEQLKLIAGKIMPTDANLAFSFYQRLVMLYPQQTNNEAYQRTVDTLTELKQGLPKSSHWDSKFMTLVEEVRQAYKAKRNLMKLLKQHFA